MSRFPTISHHSFLPDTQLKKQSAEVSEKLLAEKEKLANIRQHAADADKEINDLQTEFERAQEEDEKSHQNAEKRLVEMRKKLEQVKAEEKRLVQQKSQPAPDEMAKEARMKSLNASMAQKLDGKNVPHGP
jgi:seryl-tRNA synthetase